MSDASVIDLNTVIDGQKVRWSTVVFLAIATLTMVSDGFDLSAIGYVGPELVKAWHVSPSQLVPMFSAGIVGLLVGAPILGFLGDRFGRKKAIVVSLCFFGAMSLAAMAATSLPEFVVLRFLTGIGLGGLFPNTIALTAELAPKRLRGRFVVIVNFGVPAGISLPGFVAAGLVPAYGWPVLLLVGGLLPLAAAVLVLFLLPESLKFLAERGRREEEVRRLARALRPDLRIGPATRLTSVAQSPAAASGSPARLFAGSLAIITPMLWIALAANQMVNFFSLSWLPTLLQAAGSTTAQAGVAASMFSVGGLAGGLFLTFLVDRFGVIPLVLLFVAGVPLVAAIGTAGLDPVMFRLIVAGAGFCVTGINFGMSATLGTIYPTPVRSMGTGWGQAAGRVGSLAAPLVGGYLLAMHLPMQELLMAPAITLGLGAVACIVLAILCVRRFGGTRLDEVSAADAGEARLAPAIRTG